MARDTSELTDEQWKKSRLYSLSLRLCRGWSQTHPQPALFRRHSVDFTYGRLVSTGRDGIAPPISRIV